MTTLYRDAVLEKEYIAEEVATATFALGCFWKPDSRFGILPGVIRTRVGYAGGTSAHPTYRQLDGHAETLQVDYDPSLVTYQQLLETFWQSHDSFAIAASPQYRSVIFVHNESQLDTAHASLNVATAGSGARPQTEIVPFERMTRAENYHQKYRLQALARARTVREELLDRCGTFNAFVDSTVAARINGYIAGWGSREKLEQQIGAFGLSEMAKAELRAAVP